MEFNDQSYENIGAAMEVHNELGPGLREKPYENALVIALGAKLEVGLVFNFKNPKLEWKRVVLEQKK